MELINHHTAASREAYYLALPAPEVVQQLGLYVTDSGTNVTPVPPQIHAEFNESSWQTGQILQEFKFVYVAEGSGEFESHETGLLDVTSSTLIMLFPDVWHRYRPLPDSNWTEYWISLGGDMLHQWHQRGLFSTATPLTTLPKSSNTVQTFRDIVDFDLKHPEQDAPLLAARAMAVIANAMKSTQLINDKNDSNLPNDPLVSASLRFIWNNSHQQLTVDTMAKQIGVTRRTLERRFKKHLGRTPMQELVACRIQRAKRLLGQTDVPIKSVAYAAGFGSLSSLCRIFRRELETTPGAYRESQMQK